MEINKDYRDINVLFIIMFIAILLMQHLFEVILGLNNSIIDEVSMGTIFLYTILKKVLLKQKIVFDRILLWSAVLLVYSVLLHYYYGYPDIHHLYKSIVYTFQFVFLIVTFSNIEITQEGWFKFFRFLENAFFIIVIIGLIDYLAKGQFLGLLGYESMTRYGLTRFSSIFKHPVRMGWLSAVMGYYFYYKSFYVINKFDKRILNIWSIKFFIALSVMVLTNSRKSMMIFAILIVITTIWARKDFINNSWKVLFVILFISLLVFSITIFFDYFLTMGEYTYREYVENSENAARLVLYRTSYEIIKEHFPFGVGIGKFGDVNSLRPYSHVYYEYGFNRIWGLSPDNPKFLTDTFWAKPFGEWGVVGSLIYIGIIFNVFLRLNRVKSKILNIKSRMIVMFFGLVYVHTLLEGVAEPTLSQSFYMVFVFGFPIAIFFNRHNLVLDMPKDEMVCNKKN